ncbi:MAG: DUF3376 domain-containing protein, partial [Allosphingosinicella sp.]
HLHRLGGGSGERPGLDIVRQSVWRRIRTEGLADPAAMTAKKIRPELILFLRKFDLSFRIRRLRSLALRLVQIDETGGTPSEAVDPLRQAIYDLIGRYNVSPGREASTAPLREALVKIEEDAGPAMESLADLLDARRIDEDADVILAERLGAFPKLERRSLILTYLGFPFYDITTLPLLQGEGLDEFDPVKVDRISPEDATAIREGGAPATLKGIQFNSFGAFFSRAYRENDYLWGRLHGADRLIDIVVSSLPEGSHLPPGTVATLKREAFHAILDEERPRLKSIDSLFDQLDKETGRGS